VAADLEDIAARINREAHTGEPPLERWDPPLSGTIDIHIDGQGRWYHEGTLIQRESLVRLFASILRRERDGYYYLVTPVEKWRVQVEILPLIVTDIEPVGEDEPVLQLTLNTGKPVALNSEHPLFIEPRAGDVAAVRLNNGLAALFSRNAWYRAADLLVTRGDQVGLESAGQFFPLAAAL